MGRLSVTGFVFAEIRNIIQIDVVEQYDVIALIIVNIRLAFAQPHAKCIIAVAAVEDIIAAFENSQSLDHIRRDRNVSNRARSTEPNTADRF